MLASVSIHSQGVLMIYCSHIAQQLHDGSFLYLVVVIASKFIGFAAGFVQVVVMAF